MGYLASTNMNLASKLQMVRVTDSDLSKDQLLKHHLQVREFQTDRKLRQNYAKEGKRQPSPHAHSLHKPNQQGKRAAAREADERQVQTVVLLARYEKLVNPPEVPNVPSQSFSLNGGRRHKEEMEIAMQNRRIAIKLNQV